MLNDLLEKYKDKKPAQYGESHQEKSYPVSAVIAIYEGGKEEGVSDSIKELEKKHEEYVRVANFEINHERAELYRTYAFLTLSHIQILTKLKEGK
jgi:phage replication-related protein YjqB (UPF0714/DUF867 family)